MDQMALDDLSENQRAWELIMEGLFLFGVILGFFVIRNWSKEQKDFLTSLTAVLGGAVISTALGPLTKSVDSIQFLCVLLPRLHSLRRP